MLGFRPFQVLKLRTFLPLWLSFPTQGAFFRKRPEATLRAHSDSWRECRQNLVVDIAFRRNLRILAKLRLTAGYAFCGQPQKA